MLAKICGKSYPLQPIVCAPCELFIQVDTQIVYSVSCRDRFVVYICTAGVVPRHFVKVICADFVNRILNFYPTCQSCSDYFVAK